jgi:bifunctional N-acetylglucosamine-1-phosphate-uridyltransferase/glucosamine-1-phosphate-acetyltransferase GlmU-like protein
MADFEGNKTLLPLIAGPSPYEGRRPMLLEILDNLPPGPKALVVHHRKEDLMGATSGLGLTYCEQMRLDGTGGALLAARPFLEAHAHERMIITMGDVPLVREKTYVRLLHGLQDHALVILGFRPQSRARYGLLELEGRHVKKIIEWRYWKDFPRDIQDRLQVCNSGIYAGRRAELLKYLSILSSRPHRVRKEVDGKWQEIKEYFVTDLVEFMNEGRRPVGYHLAPEEEVLGVDDLPSLLRAQAIYDRRPGPERPRP